MNMRQLFHWHGFDATALLPRGWQDELHQIAGTWAVRKDLVATSVTSRETPGAVIPVTTVDGGDLSKAAPWLQELYEGPFCELAKAAFGCEVTSAQNRQYGVNLNVQRGELERYEAHVDSNPIQGLLYVTTHPPGTGGELVIANRSDAIGLEQIDADCSIIHPMAGSLLFFDARLHPHYVRPLADKNAVRISVPMNYYTDESTEDDRPSDLNEHLFASREND
ncbi:MAG TPA: hypothetical protein DEG88_06330 [Propionibacteriaceae bacterium]|nr:hypothetical protein [Actinomycetota bacterium]HBX80051.1 hypothetical protein [Propionibacteriaceae bacterium]HBY22901.1 hypothetical protein [Propionibacteriaceae bacterium]